MKTSISKKLTMLCLCALFCAACFGQQQEKLYFMHQREGSQKQLQQYLAQLLSKGGVKSDTLDNIYVNFIPPMGCPRCEGVVAIYNKVLLKNEPTAFLVNVLIYRKEKALGQYISKQNFTGSLLVADTSDLFAQIFHVNNEEAIVPYITKISLKQGRLITAASSLGATLDNDFISLMVNKNDFDKTTDIMYEERGEQPLNIALHLDKWQEIVDKKFILMPYDSCSIIAADTLPFVETFAVSRDGANLLVNNFLTSSFVLYSKQSHLWVAPTALLPSQAEDTMFIGKSVTPYVYQYLKSNNVLVSMYLKAAFMQKNIYLTASLPKADMVWKEDSTASVAYFNMPVLILKNGSGNNIATYQLDMEELENDGFAYSHSNGSFFADDSIFVYTVQKGWPAAGTEALPQNDSQNPFISDFYNEAPTLCFYSLKNKTITKTAPLDAVYKKYKLGYYVSAPAVKKIENTYYMTDKRLGKIYSLSKDFASSTRLADLFGMDTVMHQMPYSEDLPYMDSYQKFFNREIIDFEVSNKSECKALVLADKHYYLYQTKKNKLDCTPLPDTLNGMKISGVQFGRDSRNSLIVYGLYQNSQNIVVYSFKL
ncbi:MAG: hypothetical protein LBS01_03530 [Prevotellaceae bacterium]|jgi:hypothetical protein|nr:hypothetical protein [Prevotellaceae bacterium]